MSDEASTQSAENIPDLLWGEAIKRREPAAWTAAVEIYGSRLRNDIIQSIRKYGLTVVSHVEDVAQETWMRALKKITEFEWKDRESFYHWLRKIAFYIVYEMSRSAREEENINDYELDDVDSELEHFVDKYHLYDGGIEDIIEYRELMRALDGALRAFKPRQQEILVRWLYGEKPRQLAAAYNATAREISQFLWRAKPKLEAHLAAFKDEPHEDSTNE